MHGRWGLLLLAACDAPKPATTPVEVAPAASVASVAKTPPGAVSADASVVSAPVANPAHTRPVLQHCVMHAGGAHSSSHRDRLADGGFVDVVDPPSCWFNAECTAKMGQFTPGDGDVSVSCTADACECKIEPASLATDDRIVIQEPFRIDEPCTTEVARKLLVERCMKDMPPPIK